MRCFLQVFLTSWTYFKICSAFITEVGVRLPMKGYNVGPGAPWPLPQQWVNTTEQKTLDPSAFLFATNNGNCDILTKAFERYKKLITLSRDGKLHPNLPRLTRIQVDVEDKRCDKQYYPTINSSEAYNLHIDTTAIVKLTAPEIWGALRGLETFSQLIYLDSEKRYALNKTTIADAPRFAHRGIMVDTARHFIPMSILLKIIETMSWDKFNVFHWHVVDDQAFPYPLKVFANMSTLGAYTKAHTYSSDDVKKVIEECRIRGIRVIPEFDTPGHTFSWGKSLPGLLTPCWGQGKPYTPDYPNHSYMELINPIHNYTYDTLAKIFEEIVRDFPDTYIHLGFDEAYHACWQSNPNISDFMAQNNIPTYSALEGYYENRLIEGIRAMKEHYIIWQDPIDNNITFPSTTIVEIWKDTANSPTQKFLKWEEYARQTLEKGDYDIILAAPWYMNVMNWPLRTEWRKYYDIEPTNFSNNTADKARIKGGEAPIWMEYEDGGSILSTLWPRVSTVAERLWSPEDTKDTDSAQYRLDQQRCRMVRRGIPARPFLPGYCGDYESGMPRPSESGVGSLHQGFVTLLIICALSYVTLR